LKKIRAVLLMATNSAQRVCELARRAGIDLEATTTQCKHGLIEAFSSHQDLLLSFGTGLIVPDSTLTNPSLLALNVHAGSPQYPGRDPHHFAVYDGARQYGATMHYMIKSVDSGPIVDVELFAVGSRTSPHELLGLANEASWRLIDRFFQKYVKEGRPAPIDIFWSQRKTTRQMFLDLCRVSPEMSEEEILRRYHAVSMPGYRNLYLDLAGLRFRADEITL